MSVTMEVTIKNGDRVVKKFNLKQTTKAKKTDDGMTKAKFQPEADNKVIMSYSKLSLDTTELAKK